MDLKYRGSHPIYDFHNFYTNAHFRKKCENHLFFIKIAILTKKSKIGNLSEFRLPIQKINK